MAQRGVKKRSKRHSAERTEDTIPQVSAEIKGIPVMLRETQQSSAGNAMAKREGGEDGRFTDCIALQEHISVSLN
ncbi:hypothetical protein DRN79_03565 [Methanosarcinales archaeon]|nr:MAG: hypothetical protein DRN79_03565 [Methanosarcinales archaeon]